MVYSTPVAWAFFSISETSVFTSVGAVTVSAFTSVGTIGVSTGLFSTGAIVSVGTTAGVPFFFASIFACIKGVTFTPVTLSGKILIACVSASAVDTGDVTAVGVGSMTGFVVAATGVLTTFNPLASGQAYLPAHATIVLVSVFTIFVHCADCFASAASTLSCQN